MIHTVLFDLDGTLLNTIDDLADAGNWVCAQHGWPEFTVEQFKHMVGNGIPKLVERFSPADARTPEQLAATLAEFTARYDAHKEDKTAPYPGIAALIDALNTAGVQCAVFSNKADPLCGKIIEHYFGAGRFVLVRGSRPGVPTKPDPTGVYSLMQDLHADPASTLFVGDSDVDILTGHNAGLPAMGALWGFRMPPDLLARTEQRSLIFFAPAGIPFALCLLLTLVSATVLPQLTVTLLIPTLFFGALLAGAAAGYRREGLWLREGRMTLRRQQGLYLHCICVFHPDVCLTAAQSPWAASVGRTNLTLTFPGWVKLKVRSVPLRDAENFFRFMETN